MRDEFSQTSSLAPGGKVAGLIIALSDELLIMRATPERHGLQL